MPQEDINMVWLTVFDIVLALRVGSTATTVPTVKTARTEYYGARLFDGNETKTANVFTISLAIW